MEEHCPQAAGFDATKKAPKFVHVNRGLYRHDVGSNQKEFMAIEEIEGIDGLLEGAIKTIFVNAYERNPEARRECIRHHGWACKVCGFDFKMAYGELGRDFIHVHHIKPLSEIKSTYRVNPKKTRASVRKLPCNDSSGHSADIGRAAKEELQLSPKL